MDSTNLETTEIAFKDTTPLRNIERIMESTSYPASRSDFQRLVELPLLPACQRLYDLNIRTFTSSANNEDLKHGTGGMIGIEFSTLSAINKAVAETIAEVEDEETPDGRKLAYIRIPLYDTDTVVSIQERAMEKIKEFKKQKMRWVIRYKADQVKEFMFLPKEKVYTIQELEEGTGLYYDEKSNYFYINGEQAEKANEDVDE